MRTTRTTRLLMMMMRCEETPRQLPRASFSSTASSLLCLSLSASSRLVIMVLCGFLVAPELLPSACVSPFLSFLYPVPSWTDASNVVDRSSSRSSRSLRDDSQHVRCCFVQKSGPDRSFMRNLTHKCWQIYRRISRLYKIFRY